MLWCSAPDGMTMLRCFRAAGIPPFALLEMGQSEFCLYFKCSELCEITCQLFAIEKIADVVGDAAVFVGGDDPDLYGTGLVRDGGGVALIGFFVDGDAEEGELA
jgi:hypothetical protein